MISPEHMTCRTTISCLSDLAQGERTYEDDVVDPSNDSSTDDGDEDGDGGSVTSSLDFLTA